MSRLSLKNDFKDGEVLYGKELNTNNDATVAAVNDNYERIISLQDLKADVVDVNDKLKTKVDVGTFNDAINSLNDTKADKSVVNQKADKTELANKADLIYVNNELSKKADISYVNTQLTQKANLSDVNSKLSLKADKATTYTKDEVNTTIDNKIVSKADKTELANKADKSSLGDLSQLLTSDKSSAVAAINETIREGVANNIDALSITKSNDNKIQTVGVIDSNAKGYATKTWTGTRNEYNSIQNKNANTLYYIIDDDDEHELVANKVKTIDENSNDTQYPSAKAVYDRIKESAPDLSNYVQYDNYAVSNKGGVIKGNLNGFNVDSSGTPLANVYNKESYDSGNESIFISKGTLENIKDDYVGTSEPINVLNDTLDNVVPKQTATDSIINVNDALKYKTFNFKVDGAYEQNGEPTPEAPIPITTLTFDKITKNGQNLFDVKDKYNFDSHYSIDENDWITLNIENAPNEYNYYSLYTNNLILKPDTNYNVILEIKNKSGLGTFNVVSFKIENNKQTEGQFVNSFSNTFGNLTPGVYNKIIKTLSSDTLKNTICGLRTYIMLDKGAYSSITFRISVIEDTSVTPDTFTYQPYKETNYSINLQNNEMVSLPNSVKDELQIDKEGNVSLIKNVGKKVINGSEEWMMNTNYTTSSMLAVQYLENSMLSNSKIISDHFTYNAVTGIDTIRAAAQYILIGLDITEFATVGDFNNWLQSNNTTIYYQLAYPQTISLGKLEDLISTEQGSNTFAINGNIDTNISTTYALDLKKYIDNKIATVSQAVLEQE